MQDTGVIQGISQASPHLLRRRWRSGSRNWPKSSWPIRRSQSLSSFIGADGTNTTLNSGRFSINLKPLDQRDLSAADVIRRLQGKLAQGRGVQLYMQPVQNITVDDRVSAHAISVHARRSRARQSSTEWTKRFVAKLKQIPDLEDVATDQQTGGLAGLDQY